MAPPSSFVGQRPGMSVGRKPRVSGSLPEVPLDNFRYAYLAPARGVVRVNGNRLEVGDGIAACDESELAVTAETDAEVVLVTATRVTSDRDLPARRHAAWMRPSTARSRSANSS